MVVKVGFLLPYPGGDGSWIDGALAAVALLGDLGPEVTMEVVTGMPAALPAWDVVVCHGIQYESIVRDARGSGADVPVVILSDVPFDRTGLDGVTCIDWAWNAGAYCAGAVAAAVSDGRPVGLIAGPAVRTQVRLAFAFARGAARGPSAPELVTVHLPSFDDVAGGVAAGTRLVEAFGCAVVAHTADAAGAAGVDAAASAAAGNGTGTGVGVATMGFLSGETGRLASIRSNIDGVLARLVRDAVAGRPLPPLVTCTFENGDLALELAPDAPASAVEAARAAVAELARGEAQLP